MRLKLLLLLIGSVIFPISFVNGEMVEHVTYMDYTEKAVTVRWDASEDADNYKFKLHHVEKNIDLATGTTSRLQVRVNFPRSGHYIFLVQACNEKGCSEQWARSDSIEYAKVNGQVRSWWIYRYLSPPGPIIIE